MNSELVCKYEGINEYDAGCNYEVICDQVYLVHQGGAN